MDEPVVDDLAVLDRAIRSAVLAMHAAGYSYIDIARRMQFVAASAVELWRDEMVCEVCGRAPARSILAGGEIVRVGRRFCSNACRQKAYRVRRASAREEPVP